MTIKVINNTIEITSEQNIDLISIDEKNECWITNHFSTSVVTTEVALNKIREFHQDEVDHFNQMATD